MKKSSTVKKKENEKRGLTNNKFLIAGIVVFTALVFSNCLSKNFLSLDDTEYINDNPYIKSLSWESIKNIFSVFYNANYHPLTTLVYAIEFKLFGLNGVPFHFFNLLLHLANVCLVFVLIEKISNKKEIAAIAALFFGIHPMHVESVAWISETKDVLYTFFYLSGLIIYTDHIRKNNIRKLLLTFFLFLFSLLSKSAAVTFPLLLVLFDYYFNRGWNRKVLVEKIPFFLLAVGFGIITILSQKSAGAMDTAMMGTYTPFERIFVVSYTILFYFLKFFVPLNLSALHYSPAVIPTWFYFCPLLILFIAWSVLKAKSMQRALVFGLLFFLFSIILTLQIIPVGITLVSDRYTYLPYIGLFFIAGNFYQQVAEGKISFALFMKPYLIYIFFGIAILFSILSFQRNKIWDNDLALFSDIAKKNPESAYAQFQMGNIQSSTDIQTALATYAHALELDSTLENVYFYRGIIYHHAKQYNQALKDYFTALKLKKDANEVLNNIGNIYLETAQYEKAVEYFGKGISVSPNEILYNSRANANYFLKKYTEAISDYNSALKIKPDYVDAYFNRGLSYFSLQKNDSACSDWQKAYSLGSEKAGELLQSSCK